MVIQIVLNGLTVEESISHLKRITLEKGISQIDWSFIQDNLKDAYSLVEEDYSMLIGPYAFISDQHKDLPIRILIHHYKEFPIHSALDV